MLTRWSFALLALMLASISVAQASPSLFTIDDQWIDEQGQAVQLARWRGKQPIVAMEYSACRFICSVYWRRLQQIQAEADKRGQQIQFVILSIDPEHDSPASWREYRLARGLTRDNWHFLTGSRAMTTRAAALLGVRWWYDEDHLMHDFKVVRLDGAGAVSSAMTSYDEPLDVVLLRP